MTAALTDQDKERVRYHLGYMAPSFAASLSFGLPRPIQTMFIVEQAMVQTVEPNAVARIRCLLDTLDGIEKQLLSVPRALGAERVGNITLRGGDPGKSHGDLLEREYVRWAGRLADVLGAPLYPYSARFGRGRGAGMIPRTRTGG